MHSKENDIDKMMARFDMMTTTPVRRLVVKMAIPTILSMVVTGLYNLVDAYFVGRISTEATAAVGLAFAYQSLIQALGFGFGHGSGNYISRALGLKDYSNAETMASVGFFSSFICGLIIGVCSLAFLTPLSFLLGATDRMLEQSNDYLLYILIATPFMISQAVLNNQLRLQGNSMFAMVGLVSGAVINCALDPLLIFVFDMGVAGASLATFLSQLFSWCILVYGTGRGGNVHIRITKFKPSWYWYKEIIAGGLPSLLRQSLGCIAAITLNHMAKHYSVAGAEESTIAAFSVVNRIMMFAMTIFLGIGQGFQPVCGFNWGASMFNRVKKAYLFTMQVTTICILVLSVVGFIFATPIVAFFRPEDLLLISVGAKVLRYQCISFPLVGITTPTNMLYQTIRRTGPATLLAMGRQGIFFFPIIIILPLFIGLNGVMLTMALADVGTFFLALPYCIRIIREMNLKHAQDPVQ